MRRLEASLRRAAPKGHETFISRTAPHRGLAPTSGPPCVQDTLRHPQSISPPGSSAGRTSAAWPTNAEGQPSEREEPGQRLRNEFRHGTGTQLVSSDGTQIAALSYPGLDRSQILDSVDTFYRRHCFRAGKIGEMSAEMIRHPEMTGRRLREGVEFVHFLNRRSRPPASKAS